MANAATDATLPAEGGTVGPLPDGTMIEVAPIEWTNLRRHESRIVYADLAAGECRDPRRLQRPGDRMTTAQLDAAALHAAATTDCHAGRVR